MANSSSSPEKRRRLPRFSLRTLLIVMVVLGIGLGSLGGYWQRVKAQRRIVAAVEAAGGEVKYDYQFGVGQDLDAELDFDKSVEPHSWSTSLDTNDDGYGERRRYDYRWTRYGGMREALQVEVETPSGPKLLRRAFGDDLFSNVEEVSFFWSSLERENPAEFNPHLLLQLPQLKVVVFTEGQVCDEWLRLISGAREIRVLHLAGGDTGNATAVGLRKLQTTHRLEVLGLSGAWVRDDSLKGIADLRQLRALNLSGPDISPSALENLRELTELRELTILRAYRLDDRGIETLANLQNLRRLWLTQSSITDDSAIHIAQLKQLKCLDLSWSLIGDPGLEKLAGLSNLMRLDVSHSCISDHGVKHLARIHNLRSLSIGATSVTDEAMPTIAEMSQLEILSLYPGTISDAGLLPIKRLKNLQRLDVGPNVSKAAVDDLQKALPNCEITAFGPDSSSL